MNVILFDDIYRESLLPFTYTRPQAEIRIGILSVREKWEKYLHVQTSTFTENYLSEKFPLKIAEKNVLIASSVCPTATLIEAIVSLKCGQTLVKNGVVLAHALTSIPENLLSYCGEKIEFSGECLIIMYIWQIFYYNETELRADFDLLTKGRTSQSLGQTNCLIGDEKDIFIEEGAVIEASVFNVKNSKIYIGKNAEIMEGCLVRGSFALCEESQLKLGAKVYGATTIGPHCKVGGEVNNVVFFGYSNKAHDGFMGNSVIGEWCNIGADSNTSNLKNDYGEVKLWNYAGQKFQKTGLQFCGLIMGDHVKCGINTMFNTGSVIGVASNLFGAGYMPNFVASFLWGGPGGFQDARLEKILTIAEKAYKRRNVEFNDRERNILIQVYNNIKNNKEPQFPNFYLI